MRMILIGLNCYNLVFPCKSSAYDVLADFAIPCIKVLADTDKNTDILATVATTLELSR